MSLRDTAGQLGSRLQSPLPSCRAEGPLPDASRGLEQGPTESRVQAGSPAELNWVVLS